MKKFTSSLLILLTAGFFNTVKSQDSISLVGQLTLPNIPIHDVWGYTDSVTNTRYALVGASDEGLRIVDLSDVNNPTLAGTINGSGVEVIDVKVWKNYAYVVGESSSVRGKIIDLSDPANPVKVGDFPSAHNITISENGYMYLSARGLRVMDLNADPINPSQVYFDNSCEGHDITIVGDMLYDFPGNCGTRIFDISQPDTLILLGELPTGGYQHSGWPSADGKYIFVCDELAKTQENDITIWDISDLNAPFKVDSFIDPLAYVHNLYVINNYAYVSYYKAGFRVFDVSNPANMQLVATYDTDPNLSGPGYGGNFGLFMNWGTNTILASDENNGLFVFHFSGLKTGLFEQKATETLFDVFPNPVSELLTIQGIKELNSNAKIQIFNVTGVLIQELKWDNLISVNVKDYQAGMYYVVMNSNKGIQTKPFFVVK
jgi:choice-of-anchor B domain-containing protein